MIEHRPFPRPVPHGARIAMAFLAWLALAPAAVASPTAGEVVIRAPGATDSGLATQDTVGEILARVATRFDPALELIATVRADFTACLHQAEAELRNTAAEGTCDAAVLAGRIDVIDNVDAAMQAAGGDLAALARLYRGTSQRLENEMAELEERVRSLRTAEDALLDALEERAGAGLDGLSPTEQLELLEVVTALELSAMELDHIQQESAELAAVLEAFQAAELSIASWIHELEAGRIALALPRRQSELILKRITNRGEREALLGEGVLGPQLAQLGGEIGRAFAFMQEGLPTVEDSFPRRAGTAGADLPPPPMLGATGAGLAERIDALLQSRRSTVAPEAGGER